MSSAPVLSGAGIMLSLGSNYSASRGTAVTGSGSGNGSYGSWVELSSSVPYDTSAIDLFIVGNASGTNYFDLGIGGAGSEVVIATRIPFRGQTVGDRLALPLAIPKGVRLAMRVRYGFSNVAYVTAQLTPAHPWFPHGYRYAEGLSEWTSVDAGAVANTLSSYINHTTNLPGGIKALYWGLSHNASDNTSDVLAELEYDSTLIATATLGWTGFSNPAPRWLLVPGNFRSGTTVRSRHQCSATATNSGRTMFHALVALG